MTVIARLFKATHLKTKMEDRDLVSCRRLVDRSDFAHASGLLMACTESREIVLRQLPNYLPSGIDGLICYRKEVDILDFPVEYALEAMRLERPISTAYASMQRVMVPMCVSGT